MFKNAYVKMDIKKKSHTSSELSTIKGYLFSGRLTDHSPLPEWENSNQMQQPEETARERFTLAFII